MGILSEIVGIVAVDSEWGIGKNGKIPWHFPKDILHFKTITTIKPKVSSNDITNVLIMGKKTWESINRALPERIIIVISTTMKILEYNNVFVMKSLNDAVNWCMKQSNIYKIFLTGGSNIYNEGMLHPLCNKIIITKIKENYQCDVMFPKYILNKYYKKNQYQHDEYNDYSGCQKLIYTIETYIRYYTIDREYLTVLKNIMNNGELTPNRTSIDTLSLFSQHMRFNLYDELNRMIIPLLTTKYIPFRIVYEELLWFLNGATTTDYLLDKNIHIWDANSTREYLDKQGLDIYRVGELGPIYGWQWRNFGAKYIPECNRDIIENQQGIDQILNLINQIKTDPYGRRHVLTAWNPCQLDSMALPPCHLMSIFKVSSGNPSTDPSNEKHIPKWLSCQLIMRSADEFLGVPFNIASYALLTHIISILTGLHARELSVCMVDAHIYVNHISGIHEQLSRKPYGSPYIEFDDDIIKKSKNNTLQLSDFNSNSFKLINYYSHSTIKANMAV
jgi:dihydrofolate reductase/thymidylate synthase